MEGGLKDSQRIVISVALSALTGVGLYFGTLLHEFIILGSAAAVFLALLLLLPKEKKAEEVMVAPGVTLAEQLAVAQEGIIKLERVSSALIGIPASDPAHGMVANIYTTLESIYAHFSNDPADIPPSAAFREHHAGKAVKLIEDYSRLVTDRLLDDQGRDYVLRCRDRFTGIESAFVAQYNAMLRHDISALEQAGRNLETSLRLEHGLETMSGKSRQGNGAQEGTKE